MIIGTSFFFRGDAMNQTPDSVSAPDRAIGPARQADKWTQSSKNQQRSNEVFAAAAVASPALKRERRAKAPPDVARDEPKPPWSV
jgi:hypothetical protein